MKIKEILENLKQSERFKILDFKASPKISYSSNTQIIPNLGIWDFAQKAQILDNGPLMKKPNA